MKTVNEIRHDENSGYSDDKCVDEDHDHDKDGEDGVSEADWYVHNFLINEENRIGAKQGINRKDMDLTKEILISNRFNWGNLDL